MNLVTSLIVYLQYCKAEQATSNTHVNVGNALVVGKKIIILLKFMYINLSKTNKND